MTDVARLYREFTPTHYDVHLTLDATLLRFSGTVTVFGDRKKSSPHIRLHVKDLQIIGVTVDSTACDFSINEDILDIHIPNIKKTSISATVHFSGTITKAMHGIYPAYTNDGSVILGTQFESHHAREAFPCIDEPEAKATFALQITTHEPIVLSNMPQQTSHQNTDDSTTFIFETTPVMSSYLVAFVCGNLQKVSTQTENGTEITVWSSKDHDIESLVFPLEVAVKTTEFFNEYFGVAYPLPKCDHVALPDFSSGAMENWGLITYREIALIADPDTISTSAKEYIATVIAHEISHQWFGNLVTMQWWDDLWLNESFATLMEYLVIDAIYPEWNVMLSFAAHDALSAFRRDVLPGVQPVATPVHHPDAISTLFDPSIVYAKGARLLYMAYHVVGDRNFKKGLRNYFKHHAYQNTVGADLWNALGAASGIDVASIMHGWITQSGFPYIKITPVDDTTLSVEQHQLTTTMHTSEKLWSIPLWSSDNSALDILDTKRKLVHVQKPHTRFNIYGGHYVPYYTSEATRLAIYDDVKHHRITPDARLLLLHDPLLLARCGVGSLTDALTSLSYYVNETEQSVWSVISLVIGDTRLMIEGNETAESSLKKLTYRLIEKQYTRLGLVSKVTDTNNDKKLRSIITGLAIYSEEPDVVKTATKIFNDCDDFEALPVDTRSAILTAVIKSGDKAMFDSFLTAYPATKNGDIQLDIAGALCATKDTTRIKKLISRLKDQQFVRLQDLDRFLVYLLRNQASRASAWQWLVTNWHWITEVFAQDKSYDNYPRYSAAVFSTQEWLNTYAEHFTPLADIPSLARNIDLGTKDITAKIEWRQRDQKAVESWLSTAL